MTDTPWEPPLAGTEAEHLTGALDRLRITFRWKADDLDAAGLQARIGASELTLGGLLKHLALCEDYMFTRKLTGAPLGPPWEAVDWAADPDWEFPRTAAPPPTSSGACLIRVAWRRTPPLTSAAAALAKLSGVTEIPWPKAIVITLTSRHLAGK